MDQQRWQRRDSKRHQRRHGMRGGTGIKKIFINCQAEQARITKQSKEFQEQCAKDLRKVTKRR